MTEREKIRERKRRKRKKKRNPKTQINSSLIPVSLSQNPINGRISRSHHLPNARISKNLLNNCFPTSATVTGAQKPHPSIAAATTKSDFNRRPKSQYQENPYTVVVQVHSGIYQRCHVPRAQIDQSLQTLQYELDV